MSKQKKTQEIVVSKDETQVFFVEIFIGAEQNEKVTINSQCGIDICLDYAKKSFIKAIHTRLALHDTGGNPNEEEQFKLKLLLLDINSLSPSNIALKNSSGNEIRFKEDLSQVAKDFIKPLSTYTLCSIGGEGTSKVIGFKVE